MAKANRILLLLAATGIGALIVGITASVLMYRHVAVIPIAPNSDGAYEGPAWYVTVVTIALIAFEVCLVHMLRIAWTKMRRHRRIRRIRKLHSIS